MKIKTLLIATLPVLLIACGNQKEPDEAQSQAAAFLENQELEAAVGEKARALFAPINGVAENPENPTSPAKIDLGKVLYFDNRLSKDRNNSCNSCHNLSSFGVDNLALSPGDAGKNGERNSPTVFNAALHSTQFWDGRAKDVEEQAGMPILNPVEMAIPDEKFLVKRLKGIDLYTKMFANAFPDEQDPITYDNIKKSLAAFERTLITPSHFDQYLLGDANALSLEEKKGLKSFMDAGCITCHAGPLLGGNMFQKFGLKGNYWDLTKSAVIDEGRFKITGEEADKYVFKVPSLRNVEKTSPYFHDGSVAGLEDAIAIMGTMNSGKELSQEEIKNIAIFLSALTADVSQETKTPPAVLDKEFIMVRQ
jgi:cytochrome c peroxidase